MRVEPEKKSKELCLGVSVRRQKEADARCDGDDDGDDDDLATRLMLLEAGRARE